MKTKAFTFFCLAFFLVAGIARADVRLPAIFSDHMVLLKADHVPVWGWADAGESVSVSLNGQTVTTTTGSDGTWRVDLNLDNSPQGPFEMVVQGKNTIRIEDVVVGEVWLGSGQSNMEQMMGSQAHAEEETLTADNPMLRQFITIKTVSLTPKENVDGFWLKVAPGRTDTMSAIGYYFSKEIHGHTQGPVGIIKASWGGKAIQPYISPDAYDSSVSFSGKREATRTRNLDRAETFFQWLEETDRADRFDVNWTPYISGPTSDEEGWVDVPDSGKIEHPDFPGYGAIWFRKEVELTERQSQCPQYMFLGMKNVDFFHVYFNGVQVEVLDKEDYTEVSGLTSRIYLPPNLLHEGVNQLAFRVFAPHKPYEFAWAPQFNLKSARGGWRGKAEYSLPELPGAVPETPLPLFMVEGSIFDGMIRPLIPYAIRGSLWYQGESNVSNPNDYQKLMPLLINGWRSEWGSPDLPFYYCQLANYLEKKDQPGESQWAELREAQSLALSVPDTGMAVLIDTGESKDIHPQSKDIAGQRLAKIALAHVYGQSIPYSGPIYESMSIEGNRLRLSFSHVEGGLMAQELPDTYWVMRRTGTTAPLVRNSSDSQLEGFAIRGADTPWVWADAAIAGDAVLVWSDEVALPVEVRYAWADNPTCNLYNQAGLPASPFRAEVPAPPPGYSSFVFSLTAKPPSAVSITFDGATANAATTSFHPLLVSGQTLAAGASYSGTSAYSTTIPFVSSGSPAAYSGQSICGGAYFRVENVSEGSTTVGNTGVVRYQHHVSAANPESIHVSTTPSGTGYDRDAIKRQVNFALLFSHTITGRYGFDECSVLTVNARRGASTDSAGATQTLDNRWVVVANGVTYVAESALSAFTNIATDYTLNNPDEINWAEWTPGADLSFGSLNYDVLGSMIEGITHAGIAGNYELGVGTGARTAFLSGFHCDLFLR